MNHCTCLCHEIHAPKDVKCNKGEKDGGCCCMCYWKYIDGGVLDLDKYEECEEEYDRAMRKAASIINQERNK